MYLRIFLLISILINQTLAQSGFDVAECGKTKHCISMPPSCLVDSNVKCQYMISHSPQMDGKSVVLELYGERESPEMQYVAVGFSSDESMGEEPVIACVSNPNGQTDAQYSYNQGKSNHPNVGVDKSDSELLEAVVTDAVIYCKIRQSIIPTNDALPNLSNAQYNVLVARGPRKANGNISYHSDRQVMPMLTNFAAPLPLQAPSDRSEGNVPTNSNDTVIYTDVPSSRPQPKGSGPFGLTSASKVLLVRYHGFLMLVSWFAMIAIGIFSARYLRPATPNTKVGGLHLWFQLHRGINFTAILFIIVAAVLVFVAKDLSWTGPILGGEPEYNWNPGAIHTVFGIIAVILALMQPIGALARCSPDHPRRPLFNWGHRTFGIIAIIFALIATFIALNRFNSLWSNSEMPTVLIIVYIVCSILLIIFLEAFAFTRLRSRRKVTINGMELQNRTKNNEDGFESTYHSSDERTSKDKLVNISGFLLFSIISIAFVVLVALFLFF